MLLNQPVKRFYSQRLTDESGRMLTDDQTLKIRTLLKQVRGSVRWLADSIGCNVPLMSAALREKSRRKLPNESFHKLTGWIANPSLFE